MKIDEIEKELSKYADGYGSGIVMPTLSELEAAMCEMQTALAKYFSEEDYPQ